jgi:formylglycine-generating enzyme required for sulfatase activity
MGRGDGEDACPDGQVCGDHETPEHDTTLSGFSLDLYEVAVGRFRQFVEAYDDLNLRIGAGAHPLIVGSGWQTEFQSFLPASEDALRESLNCGDGRTFTDTAGISEGLPVNCVSWGVAFAYCATIGGRLPTEAEWEYAAAGGDENRLYPWGSAAPHPERVSVYPSPLVRAGSLEDGEGRYGHFDLAGNVWEWALDWLDTGWYSDQGMGCENCARVTTGTHRVLRGGAYSYQEVTLRAAARSGELPEAREPSIGFRCAY